MSAASGSGEPTPGAAGEPGEPKLPDFKVTQIARSPKPLSEALSKNPDRGTVFPVGDYTVGLVEGASNIQIFDNQGREIQNAETASTDVMKWSSFRSGGNSFVAIRDRGSSAWAQNKYVSEFPEQLRPFVEKYVMDHAENHNSIAFPDDWKLTGNPGKTVVVKNDGVLLLRDANGAGIAFDAAAPDGELLPPRNWKRYDAKDFLVGPIPKKVKGMADNLSLEGATGNFYTTNDLILVSFADRLVVSKLGQKINESFSDKLVGVAENVCEDPKAEGVIYFCSSKEPRSIIKLDTTRDSTAWRTEAVDLPQDYKFVRNLRLDPTGNFFTMQTDTGFVVLDKNNLQELMKLDDIHRGIIDSRGKIRGIDSKGHLLIYEAKFADVAKANEAKKVAMMAKGLTVDLFAREGAVSQTATVDHAQYLEPVRADLEAQFSAKLDAVTDIGDIAPVSEALTKLHAKLKSEGLQEAQIGFITKGIEVAVRTRERALAEPVVAQGLGELSTKLASGNLSIAVISEARGDLAKLKSLEGLVDDSARAQIRALESQLSRQSAELFRTEGAVIESDVSALVSGVEAQLTEITSMPDFADWQEFTLPQLVSRLGMLANDCPLEATDTQKKILAARRQLQETARRYETQFREQYAIVREKASEIMGERVELMKVDIDSFATRLRERSFKDRVQAESYARSSEALEALRTEIAELANRNPEAAKDLDKSLKVQIANVMAEIERGGQTAVAETGQLMERFGHTLFPKWEGKVHEKSNRQVDLIFLADERSKGPNVTADKVLGDLGIAEINSRGMLQRRRMYEGMQNEDELRYGSVSYRGEYVFPSYLTQAEYRDVKQAWADWNRGEERSPLRKTLAEKRQALHEQYAKRQKPGKREAADEEWKEEYQRLLADYSKFSAQNYVLQLTRVEQLRAAPETDFANGAGYVPEWQNHWTIDEHTEKYLERMAEFSKMQLELQEGLLNLKGHAGTGKDVLVKMFSERIKRPYFAIDCSKWTTEFELSEDVVLEAEDGASKTVKVPSVVLNAITTPGAVMYFNEINAMPEQAQIFLHGLLDEKRTLTLKTSSGKSVRTLPSVLLIGSMNPGYPGTFNPQFATRSRMVSMDIEYPPLYRERDASDPNPNPPISSSEALRIARQIDSLTDMTIEANPEHNDFVKAWDRYINGIDNGAPELSTEQQFDMEVALTLVQFASKLREGFMLRFEKARASSIPRGALLVDQPITGRDMRRCAYFLSKMPAEAKTTTNPEAVARDLLEKLFLPNIDKKEERDEIKTAMKTWTSSKRPAA